MSIRVRFQTLASLGLVLALASGAAAQTYSSCGEMIEGVTCTPLFRDDAGATWLLDDNGPFVVGDRVRVTGISDPGCITICQQGGCILQNTIELCDIGAAYCFCDPLAPCGNTDATAGCANSSGSGAQLQAGGSTSVAADALGFDATNLVPNQPALLFVGESAVNGGAGALFGDGLRCAGTNARRLGVRTPDALGGASWGPGLNAAGGWSAGDVRRFQVWYRDPATGPCGSGFNLTHGVELTLAP